MAQGPKKRSARSKADEAARLAAGLAAMALPVDERSREIRRLVAIESKSFLNRRKKKILKLQLKDLNLNLILLRMVRGMHRLETPRDIVSYLVRSTLRAGEETAYGWMVDLFLPPLFGASTPPEREDEHKWEAFKEIDKEIERPNPKTKKRTRHLISLKSGPLTINDTMARQMHVNVSDFVKLRDEPVIYGVTYGRRDQLSNKPSIVKGQHPDDKVAILVGHELWDWLAEYDNAHVDIMNGIADGETAFADDNKGVPIIEIVEQKIDDLTDAFLKEFKIDPKRDMWSQLVDTGF